MHGFDHLRRMGRSIGVVALIAGLTAGCSDDNGGQADAQPHDAAPGDAGPQPDAARDAGTDTPAPPPDRIEIDGLSGPLQAVYDEHGILHLTCKTDEDCLAGFGYFHAANRFFIMDFVRHYMRGQLAEIVAAGDLVLESDYAIRHFMTNAQGEPLEEVALKQMSPANLELFERYADGINAWLADLQAGRNNARLTTEYDFPLIKKGAIRPWTPEDSFAVALYMMYDLGNTVDAELSGGEVAASVEADLAADLLSVRPAFQTFTTTSAGLKTISHSSPLDLGRFRKARTAMRLARSRLRNPLGLLLGGGSNNWAVGPGRTTSERALLANDPHLAIMNPAIWMPVELDAKSQGTGTIHVAGGSMPGIPVVLIGRNEKLAWGLTTVFYDLNEVYVEKLTADGTGVIFNGQEVPFLEKKLTFGNAAGDPVEKTFRWVPHHGPLLAEDPASGTAISVRWVAAEKLTDADALYALMRAESMTDAAAALKLLGVANQNFVVVDLEGNIGWFPYAAIPARPWASMAMPPWLPVPGDGSAEWAGWVDHADLPQAVNPPNGMIATANQALTDALADGNPFNDENATPAYQAWYKAIGARMTRIVDLIEAGGDQHSVDSMLAIQADTFSLMGESITPALIAAAAGADLSPAAAEVLTALQAWKYTCPTGLASTDPEGAAHADAAIVTESVGCTAFHVALAHLLRAALGDELTQAGVSVPYRLQFNLLVTAIVAPELIKSNFWDDVETPEVETMDDIMLRALDEAGATLAAWKADPSDWQWGRLHTLSLRSPFDQFGVPAYNAGPFANDGALYTVDKADPVTLTKDAKVLDMYQTAGASLRMVVEAGEGELSMKFQLPGGTSLHRDSPRYNQLLDRYLKNEPIDFAFGTVDSPAESLEVHPAGQ